MQTCDTPEASHGTAAPARTGRCDGCKHVLWIAPGGQQCRNDPRPQMQCTKFGNLDVVTTRHGDYFATVLPAACTAHPPSAGRRHLDHLAGADPLQRP